MKMMQSVTPEIIKRSVCLFSEYHGLYEDDYEGVFYWDPETGEFGSDLWSTAWGGGCCPNAREFAYDPCAVRDGLIPAEYSERIIEDLRESLLERREEILANLRRTYEERYNRYAYQKDAFKKFLAEAGEKFEEVVRGIDSIAYLLYYTPECTSCSYKNNKCTLEYAVNDGGILTRLANACVNQPLAKRTRKMSLEGLTKFSGEVISVKSEYSTYGLRSDWHTVYKVGISQGEGQKSVWFNAPKKYRPERGQKVEVYSKYVTEYDKSFNVRRPVVIVVE